MNRRMYAFALALAILPPLAAASPGDPSAVLSIRPDRASAEPHWTCGDQPAAEGGPAVGKLNESLLRPVDGFYATLADGSVHPIETLTVRFRSAGGGVNELSIKRPKSKPDVLEWRLNAARLQPGPARPGCQLPHELMQRLESQVKGEVFLYARMWNTGEKKRVRDATIEYRPIEDQRGLDARLDG